MILSALRGERTKIVQGSCCRVSQGILEMRRAAVGVKSGLKGFKGGCKSQHIGAAIMDGRRSRHKLARFCLGRGDAGYQWGSLRQF